MTELEAMLACIRENAEQTTPRRIFADWLENDAYAPEVADWLGFPPEALRLDMLANWIRTQCELFETPAVKWKAGTILGRRRIREEMSELEAVDRYGVSTMLPAPAGVHPLPGISYSALGAKERRVEVDSWGPLEPYDANNREIVAMSVCERDVPNEAAPLLRVALTARPDFCKAMAPPRWPPLDHVVLNIDEPRPGALYFPRSIACDVWPGEPVRVALRSKGPNAAADTALQQFTVHSNIGSMRPDPIQVRLARGDGAAFNEIELNPHAVYQHYADELLASAFDLSATAPVQFSLRFGRVTPDSSRNPTTRFGSRFWTGWAVPAAVLRGEAEGLDDVLDSPSYD